MTAIVVAVTMTTLVVGPFYLRQGLALLAVHAALVLSAGPLVSALTGVPAGRIVERLSPQDVARLALCVMVAGTAMLAVLPADAGSLPIGCIAVATIGTPHFSPPTTRP